MPWITKTKEAGKKRDQVNSAEHPNSTKPTKTRQAYWSYINIISSNEDEVLQESNKIFWRLNKHKNQDTQGVAPLKK